MTTRKILSYILGFLAGLLVICAVWMHEDWGWLKFLITALVCAIAAIMLVASEDVQKRP